MNSDSVSLITSNVTADYPCASLAHDTTPESDFPPVRHLMTLCLLRPPPPPAPAGAAGEGGESAETPARLGEEAVQQGAGRRREGNAASPS